MGSRIRPLKKLGQHFLKDPSVARRIVQSMGIESGDSILEIGPGEGMLTAELLRTQAKWVWGVEVDTRCCDVLKGRFGREPAFQCISADVLKLDLNEKMFGEVPVRVVGNLPYGLTSPILFFLLDNRERIRDCYIMVQKEVAERLASSPGCKAYGVPSVLFQAYASIDKLFPVPPGVFYPVPRVESMVIRIGFYTQLPYEIEEERFFRRVVRQAFQQRRKMLKNTLRDLLTGSADNAGIDVDLRRRPESLSVEEFIRLSNTLRGSV
jgi:16S rRNA (adenine1518-N6/adenine1519-N6)-dimethyltransferase